jgi:Fe-S cluster assembly protein SufD
MATALLPTRPIPTKRDEAFRYSDLTALTGVWPVLREEILVPSGQSTSLSIMETDAVDAVARHLVIVVEAGASFDLRILNCGAAYGRIAVDARLGEGAQFTLGAAQLGNAAQTLEIVTEVTHAAPNAISKQMVRSVLAGHATGTYLGKVAVARGAIGTDSAQSARAMLLDRTATANAKPELEIYADDVKCAHGCAIGELDANGLFYLESRGLTPPEAKRLMLQAFVAEAFSGAADEAHLQELALKRLGELV